MNLLHDLQNVLGEEVVFSDADNLMRYGHDETEDFVFQPDLVVKPRNVNQLSRLMGYCDSNKIPVTPRGAGTGLSGASLPINKGVLVSMEHFDRIMDIDESNMQATVESGVINHNLREAVEARGLFYPPDPASKGSCFIGGNVAHNSGGPKAVKYGVTKDYILNLEVVLPNGEVDLDGSKHIEKLYRI